MIYSTTETIQGKEIEEIVGIVTGNVVQAKHIGRDIMAGLKTIVGGRDTWVYRNAYRGPETLPCNA